MRSTPLVVTAVAGALCACAHTKLDEEVALLRDYGSLRGTSAIAERRPVVPTGSAPRPPIAQPTVPSAIAQSAERDLPEENHERAGDAALPPRLSVSVARARRPCSVTLNARHLGTAPLMVMVPEGRHRVVIRCGRRRLYAARLSFATGELRRVQLPGRSKQHRRRRGRRARGS